MLVDTNILVRIARFETNQDQALLDAIEDLWSQRTLLCITLQNLAEFWNVATRPVKQNGLGRTIAEVSEAADVLATQFPVLPETHGTVIHWRRLVEEFKVSGVMVHDTRLVAMMLEYRIDAILTLNKRDFTRFSFVTPVDPREVRQR